MDMLKLYLIPIFATLLSVIHVQAEHKIAFVIGNSAYQKTRQLRNPYNDAKKLSESFKRLGFNVIYGADMTMADMKKFFLQFTPRLKGADLAIFFYAGHGIQINTKNYLIPVDFNPVELQDISTQLVSLDMILREMEKGDHTNIIFLDACRDNLMTDGITSTGEKGRSTEFNEIRGIKIVSKGLAEVEGKANTLIAYATQPGNIALDGSGFHSPFTESLLRAIEEPGVEIRDMLTKVRMEVMKKTSGKQIPWDHSSLVKKVYLKKQHRWTAPPP